MVPIKFKGANHTFSGPVGDNGEIAKLPVLAIAAHNNQRACLVSCWELSMEELATINKTGLIWLKVMGDKTPPLSLTTFQPFEFIEKDDPRLDRKLVE